MNQPGLRFIADESCDFAIVGSLRRGGYDVVAVSEFARRSDDRDVMELSLREERILLTEDLDFGRLVFAGRMQTPGVILIRYPGNARQAVGQAIMDVVQRHGERLIGAFVVVQPGLIRISRRVPGA